MDSYDNGLWFHQCRTCSSQSDNLQSLTEIAVIGTQTSYAELLKEVTGIDIMGDRSNEITQYICDHCSHQLLLSHAFIKTALEANDRLWSTLRESKADIKSCLEIKIESEEIVQQNCEDETTAQRCVQVKTECFEDDASKEDATDVCYNRDMELDSSFHECNDSEFLQYNISNNKKHPTTSKPEYKRRKYKMSSQQDRVLIVNSAIEGRNWASLAASLGVNYKTAYRWVSSRRTDVKPRGGKKTKKLSEDQLATLLSWLENDCNLTLEQLTNKIYTHFNISVSPSTVGNYLEGRMYSCKRFDNVWDNVNSPETKSERAEYVRMLNQYIQEGKQIAWLGEIHFSLFCRMSRGRPKNPSNVEQLSVSRGPNVHLIGVITSIGALLLERLKSSLTSTTCAELINRILQKWNDIGNSPGDLVIVCDNGPYFLGVEALVAKQSESIVTVLRMASFSPMLNPTESIWTKIKINVRTNCHVSNVHSSILRGQSLQYLENVLDEAMATIGEEDCARAVQQSSAFHMDALALKDMHVNI